MMFTSNSFNVCPHCGKANSLNARFCASCGRQLSVPDEVVVCPRCHKTNSPMASFCGACGTQLRMGPQTKICPKCHRDVDVNESVCTCGYSFSGTQRGDNDRRREPKAAKLPKEKGNKNKDRYNDNYNYNTNSYAATDEKPHRTGGRVAAIFALLFLLVFAYLVVVPALIAQEDGSVASSNLRPDFIANLDKGLINSREGETYIPVYGFDLVYAVVTVFIGENAGGFEEVKTFIGIGGIVMTVFVAIFAVTVVLHLLVCIIRIFTGHRSKRSNMLFLILAALTTIWAGATIALGMFATNADAPEFLQKVAPIFVPAITSGEVSPIFVPAITSGEVAPYSNVGWVVAVIPVYYWFFTIFSACAKAKKPK